MKKPAIFPQIAILKFCLILVILAPQELRGQQSNTNLSGSENLLMKHEATIDSLRTRISNLEQQFAAISAQIDELTGQNRQMTDRFGRDFGKVVLYDDYVKLRIDYEGCLSVDRGTDIAHWYYCNTPIQIKSRSFN